MPLFISIHFYCFIFLNVFFKHDWETVLTFIQVSIKWDITCIKHGTHMRDATKYINSIEYALFAVIIAIYSNGNGLKMIMTYIYK